MTIEVRDNPDESRYEASLDGTAIGFAYYDLRPDLVVFTHTEVEPEAEGKGVASTLIGQALDDVRGRGLKIVPLCPFVRAFLKRHPEYTDLVA
jgi:predicted GNAT family acetyltransferase